MEETFRLEVFEDRTIEVPKRFLAILGISEGDEIRIVTNNGNVQSVKGVPRQANSRVPTNEDLVSRRRKEILKGKHDDMDRFDKELDEPITSVVGR